MATSPINLGGRLRLVGWSFVFVFLTPVSIVLFCVSVTSGGLVVAWIGIPVVLTCVAMTRRFTDVYRRWSGRVMGIDIPRPYQPLPDKGVLLKLNAIRKDPATWRDLAWLPVNGSVGLALCCLNIALFFAGLGHLSLMTWWGFLPDDAEFTSIGLLTIDDTASAAYLGIPIGLMYLFVWRLLGPWTMRSYARLNRWLLAPSEQARLTARVRELAESRSDTVDTQAAELRRIERDLHDGAQARLVALGMNLGMAEQILQRNPEMAQQLLSEAKDAANTALGELRDLVRGIHPPVLADRGLDGAVQALGLASPLPVEVDVDLPGRLSAPVESAAYFAVAETLTNAAKHSSASQVWVRVRFENGRLSIMVTDDGVGGADDTRGSGLAGIRRRLGAFDGTISVVSPVGGPTVVTMELPCELSSAKTSSSSETA